MPLDVLGRTRATLMHSTSPPWPRGLGNLLNVHRDRDRLLQLLILNEEFLVNAAHQAALISSLPFGEWSFCCLYLSVGGMFLLVACFGEKTRTLWGT